MADLSSTPLSKQTWSLEERTEGVRKVMPELFPSGAWSLIATALEGFPRSPEWMGIASALNGVLTRFWAASESANAFHQRFAAPNAQTDLKLMCQQEAAYFGFFTNVVSTVECFCYCVFWIGVATKAPGFAAEQPEDLRRLTPDHIAKLFARAFPKERLTSVMTEIVDSEEWEKIKDARDTLAHRGVLPRYIAADWREPAPALAAPIFMPGKPRAHPKEWAPDDQPIQRVVIVQPWLVGAMNRLLMEGSDFAYKRLVGPAAPTP
jgi:hypothetical protein